MTLAATPAVLPNPIFEGSEKRVEIDFALCDAAPAQGLRALSRSQLDRLMDLARCTIVSSRSNAQFDAYVLSESSLFVYPTKWVLKTCGTTRLLNSVPTLLEMASTIGMSASAVKYSRASFLYPEQQPSPHSGFDEEVRFLDQAFDGKLDMATRKACLLGDQYDGLQWHVYVASNGSASPAVKPTYNLEVCMTELGEEAARQFFRTEKFVSAEQTTRDTGIVYLKPNAVIDDYVFEPCGYSMNGIDRSGLITIHITPEKGFSYASVEVSGHLEDMVEPSALLAAASKIFRPGKIALALTVSGPQADGSPAAMWCKLPKLPQGYTCCASNKQALLAGAHTAFFTLSADDSASTPPGSPTTVLSHMASALSEASGLGSDSEPEAEPVPQAAATAMSVV